MLLLWAVIVCFLIFLIFNLSHILLVLLFISLLCLHTLVILNLIGMSVSLNSCFFFFPCSNSTQDVCVCKQVTEQLLVDWFMCIYTLEYKLWIWHHCWKTHWSVPETPKDRQKGNFFMNKRLFLFHFIEVAHVCVSLSINASDVLHHI